MDIITAIQDISQTSNIMDDSVIKLILAIAGLISAIGISASLVSRQISAVIREQAEVFSSLARERETATDGQENINKTYKDLIESLEKRLTAEMQKQESQYNRLREGQAAQTEQITHLTEQVNVLTGENSALERTKQQLTQDNYRLATDLGGETQNRHTLTAQIEVLKAEVQRLTKAHNECNDETAKERAAYEARINELTARIATLESELAAKQEPIEAKVTVTLQGSEGKDTPAAAENEAGKE